ncbi:MULTISPECIES: GNAT family N-acetyltransferase [Dehalococcoides]|uniref:Acetyltransferase, GNAT family n=1 Tax=Dehalococcoides mccartyi TaxID=61435 RepID=A0A1S7ATU0_9CHLR|nr:MULTISPECIES: GNAT family N-acetyltransferase [Dehalococcoides]AGG06531.1 acetyltransferase, GNAT family [Dehalococcoides mccartyi DCMB5]AQX73318.1 N-acetyltransferase [Dehalococcoides mccartyi]RAL69766.1 acetyltransferase, GNAT family [Dehalococcoides mccartyi]RAL70530.1 acetyltransferase, GNAT family [Dehalococcoides mccartyi]
MKEPLILQTPRLELVPANAEMLNCEIQGQKELGQLLGAEIPANWPPEGYGCETLKRLLTKYEASRFKTGYLNWYIILNPSGTHRELIGQAGFKGEPTPEGRMEIDYSILEHYQHHGYAMEAVHSLIGWILQDPSVKEIIAQTYPESIAAQKLLVKIGFSASGKGLEQGTILFVLPREDYKTDLPVMAEGEKTVKEDLKANSRKAAESFGEMLAAFGSVVSEIFNDPSLKDKAKEFGKSVSSSAEAVTDRFKDEEIKVKFKEVGDAAQSFGKNVSNIFKDDKKEPKKSDKEE